MADTGPQPDHPVTSGDPSSAEALDALPASELHRLVIEWNSTGGYSEGDLRSLGKATASAVINGSIAELGRLPQMKAELAAALDENARLLAIIEEAATELGDTQHPRYNRAAQQVEKVSQALAKVRHTTSRGTA